jgi:hypothetical protein
MRCHVERLVGGGAESVVTMPAVPKPASRLPLASWRVSAKSTPPLSALRPAVMMPPPGWTNTASALPAETGVDTRPSPPNVGSSPAGGIVAQWTAIERTSALWIVPLPLLTVQT